MLDKRHILSILCSLSLVASFSLSAGNDSWSQSGSNFSYTRTSKINKSELQNGGIRYTFSVSPPGGYSFDTGYGTCSPGTISVTSGTATGIAEYDSNSLPAADVSMAMSGKLITSGSGAGTQPTWDAHATLRAPFFITPKVKVIWIDSNVQITANREANWYVNNQNLHTGLSFTVGTSGNWAPSTPDKYIITAKDSSDETITDSAEITLVKIDALNVDASTPASTKINYTLAPSSVTCTAKFKVGTGDETSGTVSGSFNCTFAQNQIFSNKDLSLKLSNTELAEKENIQGLTVSSEIKSDSKTTTAYVMVDGIGIRIFTFGGKDKYFKYAYSIPSSGKVLKFLTVNGSYPAEAYIIFQPNVTPEEKSGYTFGFVNQMTGEASEVGLSEILDSLSSDWVCRGRDFSAETEKPISSFLKVYINYRTDDGQAIVTVLNNTMTLVLN